MDNQHFVCAGDCNTVSSTPGVCNMSGCTKEGEAFVACNCEDDMHAEVKGEAKGTEEIQI